MSRTFSGPTISESRDRPMTLSEVHVAAEYALKLTVSDPDLLNSLSSLKEFEVLSCFCNGAQFRLCNAIN